MLKRCLKRSFRRRFSKLQPICARPERCCSVSEYSREHASDCKRVLGCTRSERANRQVSKRKGIKRSKRAARAVYSVYRRGSVDIVRVSGVRVGGKSWAKLEGESGKEKGRIHGREREAPMGKRGESKREGGLDSGVGGAFTDVLVNVEKMKVTVR